MQPQAQMTEAVSMETVPYVVGVDVCVVPLQPIIKNGDDHSFSCDAFLPHGNHMQVELWQRGGCPCVLLEDKIRHLHICGSSENSVLVTSELFIKAGSLGIII